MADETEAVVKAYVVYTSHDGEDHDREYTDQGVDLRVGHRIKNDDPADEDLIDIAHNGHDHNGHECNVYITFTVSQAAAFAAALQKEIDSPTL